MAATEFLRACQDNDIDTVLAQIQSHPDLVNVVSEDGDYSALILAIRHGHDEVLEILLTQPNIDINRTVNLRGSGVVFLQVTPLHYACMKNKASVVARLLQFPELDLVARDNRGSTPAYWAVANGSTECLDLLAGDTRVDWWNYRSMSGKTPLYVAIYHGHVHIVQILLSIKEQDFCVKNDEEDTLALLAVKNENKDVPLETKLAVLKLLTETEEFDCWNIKDRKGETPITWVKANSQDEMWRLLETCPRLEGPRDIDLTFLPECPVCMQKFKTYSRVVQCHNGHFICSSCFYKGQGVETCPLRCGENYMGRADGFEKFLKSLQQRSPGTGEIEYRNKVPGCSSCGEVLEKESPVFQCRRGHLLCGSCHSKERTQVSVSVSPQTCSQCGEQLAGRAYHFQDLINSI